ncbi:hypothetical protein J4208_01770 [Candidatus Woesearchaeota archaeon]|nr:hypothetical protein [Candidatus Woesearchaeota archaeon]
MGSNIEINDTLKISKARGFPEGLNLEDHLKTPAESQRFVGRTFNFWNTGERLYHRYPTRVFLVEEGPKGDWLYWGHVHILRQTISAGKTSGSFEIVKIYDPDYQRSMTRNEAPEGKSFF